MVSYKNSTIFLLFQFSRLIREVNSLIVWCRVLHQTIWSAGFLFLCLFSFFIFLLGRFQLLVPVSISLGDIGLFKLLILIQFWRVVYTKKIAFFRFFNLVKNRLCIYESLDYLHGVMSSFSPLFFKLYSLPLPFC